jgi:hypothetical protein
VLVIPSIDPVKIFFEKFGQLKKIFSSLHPQNIFSTMLRNQIHIDTNGLVRWAITVAGHAFQRIEFLKRTK